MHVPDSLGMVFTVDMEDSEAAAILTILVFPAQDTAPKKSSLRNVVNGKGEGIGRRSARMNGVRCVPFHDPCFTELGSNALPNSDKVIFSH